MTTEAREGIDTAFTEAVRRLPQGAAGDAARTLGNRGLLRPTRALAIFDSQLQSRHLDLAARWLRARGTGFHTIGGCGHEGNAALAAALRVFLSRGRYRNPLVVRIANYGYQKGFGGHFHNDNALGVLRDIPGLVIASPARPDDAAAMLRTCVAAARVDGSVSAFLEPIALYHTRDLYEEGDGAWLSPYVAPSDWSETHVAIGEGRTYLEGGDLTLVSFGNGLYMSLRVARRLQRECGIRCRVLDLRWLSPLPIADLLREADATGNVLVVDETRKTGSVAEGVLAALIDAGFSGKLARVNSHDSFVPLGNAALEVLLSEDTIMRAARACVAARVRVGLSARSEAQVS